MKILIKIKMTSLVYKAREYTKLWVALLHTEIWAVEKTDLNIMTAYTRNWRRETWQKKSPHYTFNKHLQSILNENRQQRYDCLTLKEDVSGSRLTVASEVTNKLRVILSTFQQNTSERVSY